MLGLGRRHLPWQWSVAGKHPAFGDFLLHNLEGPVVKALASWADRGMALRDQNRASNRFFSYRFWTREGKKDTLVCGIVRDSSDALGRPYPLLLMGSGTVRGWGKKWATTFQAFDPMLREFEQMALRRFDTFKTFEKQLQAIPFNPVGLADALSLTSETNDFCSPPNPFDPDLICQGLTHHAQYTMALGREANLQPGMFNGCPLPVAVFMGGTPESPMVTIYSRPLIPKDFNELFSGNLKATAM